MEQYNNSEVIELIEFVKSYKTMLQMYDSNIIFEENDLSACFKFVFRFDNSEVPIQRVAFYLYKPGDHFLIDIRFKNITFNGHKMRKKMLKHNINIYRKNKNSYNQHEYDITFFDLPQLQNILECFSPYLPK